MIPYPHEVDIERAAEGSRDDYGVPAQTWSTLATVPAWVQPKSARELAQLSQGGPVTVTHTIFLDPTDLSESDRIAYAGKVYEIEGIRDAAGYGHHLEVDAHTVTVQP